MKPGGNPPSDVPSEIKNVICRQRPSTARAFVFVSLENETDIANVIVLPASFEQMRLTLSPRGAPARLLLRHPQTSVACDDSN